MRNGLSSAGGICQVACCIHTKQFCGRHFLFPMFELVSSYEPAGDQPQAIAKLTAGLEAGAKHRTLLGVTGSGVRLVPSSRMA